MEACCLVLVEKIKNDKDIPDELKNELYGFIEKAKKQFSPNFTTMYVLNLLIIFGFFNDETDFNLDLTNICSHFITQN